MNEQVIPFNQEFITELSEHRTEWLTSLFRFFSELGNVEGYLIIIALLFTVFNKRLGIYTSLVALSTIVVNHLIKISIKNPRPFVVSNEYAEAWGVSEHRAVELITEFSTPSGHAMTAAAFFSFLYLRIKNKFIRVACVSTILGIGLARPYLGVHFFEDVLLGWLLGFVLAFIAHKYINVFWEKWLRLSFIKHCIYTAIVVAGLWCLILLIEDRSITEFPLSIISILGFLSGTLISAAYEEVHINFSHDNSGIVKNFARFILMVIILMGSMTGLDWVFSQIAEDRTELGLVLRYVRYLLVSVLGILFSAKLFVILKLAKQGSHRSNYHEKQNE